MEFKVRFTDDAARDLEELYEFVSTHDSQSAADHVLAKIEKSIEDLRAFPQRGSYPKELLSLGVKEYRETFFKPYRIIYRIGGGFVYVYLVADGRRDMQSLLARRLLEA
jgi:toxin ParE1/3/4